MRKIQVKIVLIFLVIIALLYCTGNKIVLGYENDEVSIEANHLEYNPDTQVVTATNGVIFMSGANTIKTDMLIYHQDSGIVETDTMVTFTSPTYTFSGERLSYSLETEEGEITGITGNKGNIYFSGAEGKIIGEEIHIHNGTYTKCNLHTPCFSISAKKIIIKGDRIKTNGSWLRIKGVRVLPLPPMRFSANSNENWPYVEVGYESDRGAFVMGTMTQTVNNDLSYSYGAGLGTNKWTSVNLGLDWKNKLSIETDYNWFLGDDKNTLNFKAQYRDSWGRINANYSETKGSVNENDHLYQIIVPFDTRFRTEAELFYSNEDWGTEETRGLKIRNRFGSFNTEVFYQLEKADNKKTGLRVSKNVFPGIHVGLGLLGSGHRTSEFDWYPEGRMNLNVKLSDTWRLTGSGVYEWSAEGEWTTKQFSLIKDLHCFEVGADYDILEDKLVYRFNLKI